MSCIYAKKRQRMQLTEAKITSSSLIDYKYISVNGAD